MPQCQDRNIPPLDSDDSDALDLKPSESDSDESSCDSDAELVQVRVALTPVSDDATPQELQQVYPIALSSNTHSSVLSN
jgi:hypothetical protein